MYSTAMDIVIVRFSHSWVSAEIAIGAEGRLDMTWPILGMRPNVVDDRS